MDDEELSLDGEVLLAMSDIEAHGIMIKGARD